MKLRNITGSFDDAWSWMLFLTSLYDKSIWHPENLQNIKLCYPESHRLLYHEWRISLLLGKVAVGIISHFDMSYCIYGARFDTEVGHATINDLVPNLSTKEASRTVSQHWERCTSFSDEVQTSIPRESGSSKFSFDLKRVVGTMGHSNLTQSSPLVVTSFKFTYRGCLL